MPEEKCQIYKRSELLQLEGRRVLVCAYSDSSRICKTLYASTQGNLMNMKVLGLKMAECKNIYPLVFEEEPAPLLQQQQFQ